MRVLYRAIAMDNSEKYKTGEQMSANYHTKEELLESMKDRAYVHGLAFTVLEIYIIDLK